LKFPLFSLGTLLLILLAHQDSNLKYFLNMAKGLRASTKKSNKSSLREKVFGPVENARKERLSAKLLELASQPQTATGQGERTEQKNQGQAH
jgi:hypothetical protein